MLLCKKLERSSDNNVPACCAVPSDACSPTQFVLSTVKAEHWSSLGQNALAGGLLWTSGDALQEEACMGRAWWQAMWTLRRVEVRLMLGS